MPKTPKYTRVTNEQVDAAMDILLQHNLKHPSLLAQMAHPIKASDLHSLGLSEAVDPVKVVNVLRGLKLIEIDEIRGSISLTDAGRCYRERTAEEIRLRRRDTRRYWITTFIAILALIIASCSVLAQLGVLRFPQFQ